MVWLVRILLVAFVASVTTFAWAEEPSAEAVQEAGLEFNKGRKAFKDEEFEVAAEHFERADALAPNPRVLMNAIVARIQAKEMARAATLAALARELYPDDEELSVVVEEVLGKAKPDLLEVIVECEPPCRLLVESRLIHGAPAKGWRIYLEPGTYGLRGQFSGGDSVRKQVEGAAGEFVEVSLELEGSSQPRPFEFGTGKQRARSEEPRDDGKVDVTDDSLFSDPPVRDKPPADESSGVSPALFWVGVAATAGLAGVSIWSGVDALQNPGRDAVADACSEDDNDQECNDLFNQGKSAELRTNVLWGVTGGLAVATVIIGVVATDWGSDADDAARARTPSKRASIRPWFGVGQNGAAIGAVGRF